jgi:hypothetical protein
MMERPAKKFSYYRKLSAAQKRIYDRSDAITRVNLPTSERFIPVITDLKRALASDSQPNTQTISQKLIHGLCHVFSVPSIKVRVLAKRPSRSWGEMHGLYEAEEGAHPVLTVWMRTAKRKDVVAFRTFLRTIIHEFIHHLDYSLLKLEDSFHTEGFYKRESSLVRLLLGE